MSQTYPAKEIIGLYHERWEIETAFFELKSTILGGRVLRARTPEAPTSAACPPNYAAWTRSAATDIALLGPSGGVGPVAASRATRSPASTVLNSRGGKQLRSRRTTSSGCPGPAARSLLPHATGMTQAGPAVEPTDPIDR